MSHLFVSTDIYEVKNLFHEESLVTTGVVHAYHDLSLETREDLKKRIGFSPHSSIELLPSAPKRSIEAIVAILTRQKLFVALDSDGAIKRYSVPPEEGVIDDDKFGPFSTKKI